MTVLARHGFFVSWGERWGGLLKFQSSLGMQINRTAHGKGKGEFKCLDKFVQ